MIKIGYEEELYTFDELSQEAQEKAFEDFMNEPGNSIEDFIEFASSEIINNTLNDLGYDHSIKYIEFDLGHYVYFDGGLHQEEIMKVGKRLLSEKDIETLEELESITTFIGVVDDRNVHIADGLRYVQNLTDEKYNEYYNALQNLTNVMKKDVLSARKELNKNTSELFHSEPAREEIRDTIKKKLEQKDFLYTVNGEASNVKTLDILIKNATYRDSRVAKIIEKDIKAALSREER